MLTDMTTSRYARPDAARACHAAVNVGAGVYQLWSNNVVNVLCQGFGGRADGLCPDMVQRLVFDPLICVPYEDLMTEYWLL